jgi:hypothetical protein
VHRSVLAHTYHRLGREEEAAALVHETMRHDLSEWHVDEQWLISVCLLAETAGAVVGDAAPTAYLYDLLLRYSGQNAVAVPELAMDSTSRTLGLLATALGRFADAARHFEQATLMNERMGARPWVAHTQHAQARMLLRRDGVGDRERAAALLSRAQATFRVLAMREPP